jgi:REP element-mobilizing transposase RayT
MADTFFSLNVHCVFSTKNREPLLVGEIKDHLLASALVSRVSLWTRDRLLRQMAGQLRIPLKATA